MLFTPEVSLHLPVLAYYLPFLASLASFLLSLRATLSRNVLLKLALRHLLPSRCGRWPGAAAAYCLPWPILVSSSVTASFGVECRFRLCGRPGT